MVWCHPIRTYRRSRPSWLIVTLVQAFSESSFADCFFVSGECSAIGSAGGSAGVGVRRNRGKHLTPALSPARRGSRATGFRALLQCDWEKDQVFTGVQTGVAQVVRRAACDGNP